ncbi:hypothetical protein BDZ90DRAFT_233542 [Jaminaea rosea]|uniref:Telomere length regulation protein conserved domain-containing protein n=1 Tax=Jaminaea rosea TaxID=1569628 RepID=A0A316UL25_9BASI|nr:hypothetical protein BDZ90DRAFT_233542 [Jaminaea rosea]PWN25940.1 hypothetical protein BDZ90DRAFT_233542 [Jaminaea rosea]
MPQPLSWRQVQSQVRSTQLAGPLPNVESVLDILLPTLHILDLVPSTVPPHIAHKHTPQRVFGLLINGYPFEADAELWSEEEGQEWLRAFRSQAWLGDVQRALLVGSIATTWDHEMRQREGEMWEALKRAWLIPAEEEVHPQTSTSGSKLIMIQDEVETDSSGKRQRRKQSAAAVTLSGIQALSSALSAVSSTRSEHAHQPHPLLTFTLQIAEWYASFPSLLSRLIEATCMENNAAKRALLWGEVVKILASLPDRAANAEGSGKDVGRFAGQWWMAMQRQIVELVFPDNADGDEVGVRLLAELLSKLVRTRPEMLADAGSASSMDCPCFWEILLRHLFSLSSLSKGLSIPASLRKRWHLLLAPLDTRDRHNVDLSLANFFHRRFLQVDVVESKERGRPAAVGKSFLGDETGRTAELVGRLLYGLWTPPVGVSEKEASDSDSDDEEDGQAAAVSRLLTQIVLPAQRSSSALLWTAGMARAYVCSFASPHLPATTQEQQLASLLECSINLWGNSERVRRTTAQEEQYLVTLILGSLAELTSRSGSSAGRTTSRSGPFIQGVSAHLDHPDPDIRRMGMLLAELVSEAAQREVNAKTGMETGTEVKKPLDFGSSMWDGVGEGKEEARVLRTMWYSWVRMRDQARQEIQDKSGEDMLEMLGFARQEERAAVVAPSPSRNAARTPRRGNPKTRQLPQRTPVQGKNGKKQAAPRSLIVDLDEGEEELADDTPARKDPIESDNESSSSESGTSSDDEAGPSTGPNLDLDIHGSTQSASKGKPSAAANDNDELLGLGIDKKKRRAPPVYISDLTSLLRDTKERDSIRLALKHGETLLPRKGQLAAHASSSMSMAVGFSTLSLAAKGQSRAPRGEIDEHCVDLLLLLCALQNNYRIRNFEVRRRGALRALVVSAPRIAVPALVEQVFTPNYSIVQRLGMLEALGKGARELCSCEEMGVDGMEGWTEEAIRRARKEGEERVPEIKKQRNLERLTDVGSKTRLLRPQGAAGTGRGIQEIGQGSSGQSITHRQPSRFDAASTSQQGTAGSPPLASSLFLFPLITRLHSHLSDAASRLSRARSISSTLTSTSLGLTTPDLFTASPPLLLPAILDTLSLLITTYVREQRPTPLDAYGVVLPEMLDLAMHVVREGLPLLAFAARDEVGPGKTDASSGESGSGNVVTAIASLLLTTLDLALEAPTGEASRLLVSTERGSAILEDALRFAAGVFETEDGKTAANGSGAGGSGISRVGRICAAIVVRIEELRSRERERWLSGVNVR